MTQAITITRILTAIDKSFQWYDENGEGRVIKYTLFITTMVDHEVISSKRKMREWWEMMKISDYLSEKNENSAKINSFKFSQKLGKRIDAIEKRYPYAYDYEKKKKEEGEA